MYTSPKVPHPQSKDLVLVGGGHAHALVLHKWAKNPLPGARATLINLNPTSPYTGMLPGHVAGHYKLAELNIDLVRLSQVAGVRFVLDEVTNVDLEKQRVIRKNGPDIYYDILSLDIGITLRLGKLTGFDDFATPAKPMPLFAQRWNEFLHNVRNKTTAPNIAVLGGGVGGVELAMAMQYKLQEFGGINSKVVIVEQENDILKEIPTPARNKLKHHLNDFGIELFCNTTATRILPERVELSTGKSLQANFVVGTAGAKPFGWMQEIGIPCDKGFIVVDRFLKSPANPSVFAVGDCASFQDCPLPKAGVYAVRQAPILYQNLKASLIGKKLVPYRPQADFLKLISTGRKHAVGLKNGIAFEGGSIWKLKDYIDRKFMGQFEQEMPRPKFELPLEAAMGSNEILRESNMLCGGCGAKVSHTSLQSALQGFANTHSELNPDAAEINVGSNTLVVSTDHLRSFISDHSLFARIAALHAMSDIWAKGAKPRHALASITLPRMSDTLQRETLREIMESSAQTFKGNGVEIIGGHTTQGAELTIGFTVLGDSPEPYVSHKGAQPGHVIVLTKPLGTGVILAGLMLGKVNGETLYRCLDLMTRSSEKISQTLKHYVSTMTDITGFGLAGHLQNLLESSRVGATLKSESIPIVEGALELSANGVRSSLWKANSNIPLKVTNNTAAVNLLFDPQTSGGLLATISEKNLALLQPRFDEIALDIHSIGKITEGLPLIEIS